MELDFAFLATAADVHDGRFSVIGGGFDTFTIPIVPAMVPPFYILFKFSISEEEKEATHQFDLAMKPPNGEVQQLAAGFAMPFTKWLPGRRSSTTIVMQLVTPFEQEGKYDISISGDGSLFKEVSFHVVVDPSVK